MGRMVLDPERIEEYWQEIPIGKENAISYEELALRWGKNKRKLRLILHELGLYDCGDNYVLVRSSSGSGFYRTDDHAILQAYKRECLNKGRSVLTPIKKINRVLAANSEQYSIENNLRVVREEKGITQSDVCEHLKSYGIMIDKSLLSKFENGVCLPTPSQLSALAAVYGADPAELLNIDIFIG